MSDTSNSTIRSNLEAARRDLLDLSLRNGLLNFRGSRVRGATILSPKPAVVFETLVTDRHPMTFTAAADTSEASSEEGEALTTEPMLLLPDENGPSTPGHLNGGNGLALETNIHASQLRKQLIATEADAHTLLEEQGVSTLFVALGMLEWYEDDASQRPCRAPLVLIPVSLERKGRDRFQLAVAEDEIDTNLSLQERLRDFRLSLPDIGNVDDLDVEQYFDKVAESVAGMSRWRVDSNVIVLGFFSYQKYLMYKDLDAANWPGLMDGTSYPVAHGLLGPGFGDPGPWPAASSDESELLPPLAYAEVVESDSSQAKAVSAVSAGRSSIIQGPPGTGKSQTIANMIADAIFRGKSVLFVTEKQAALRVVKERLDKHGVGDACLELHGQRARKRKVLAELERVWRTASHAPQAAQGTAALGGLADRLDRYAEAMHRPIRQSGVTPFAAIGELERLLTDNDDPPTTDFAEIAECTSDGFAERHEVASTLQGRIAEWGPPCENPFFGCLIDVLLPGDLSEIRPEITEARRAVQALDQALSKLELSLALSVSHTTAGATLLVAAGKHALAAPVIAGVCLTSPAWVPQQPILQRAVDSGRKLAGIKAGYADKVASTGWSADCAEARTVLLEIGSKCWRLLSPRFRRTWAFTAALCSGTPPRTITGRLAIVETIIESQRCRAALADVEPAARGCYGSTWHGEDTDFETASLVLAWVCEAHRLVAGGEIPAEFLDMMHERPPGPDLADRVTAASNALDTCSSHLGAIQRRLVWSDGLSRVWQTTELQQQAKRLETWGDSADRLANLVSVNAMRGRCEELGLYSLWVFAETRTDSGSCLVPALARAWFGGQLRVAVSERPELRLFDRMSHEESVTQYQNADLASIARNRSAVREAHLARLPARVSPGETGILLTEINRQRGIMPIRKLMTAAPGPIQAIKPVFMMSPLSIAQFLAADGPRFDIVIFDEASQVKPADALGAVLRGSQLVVVGDSKQMPPTSFFERIQAGDGEDDEDTPPPPVVIGDMESILSLASARGMDPHSPCLEWHYRSKHHSLIAVSNHLFYEDRLKIPPSNVETSQEMGLIFQHLPRTVYGRGGSRTNTEEARAVARSVADHARNHPDKTLGVVAFSSAQQRAILAQLETLRFADDALRAFCQEEHPSERFFVRNLENVQGDERDVIVISVGYGKDQAGNMTLNFGPLNNDGGERRLNVLITRARERCEVFANFRADELDLAQTRSSGVAALKAFLQYAERRELDVPHVSGRGFDSAFEEEVAARVTALGYEVHGQVGSAGFFVDLAVVDPALPGRYLLGIECDGAKYHSTTWARERDRLRQSILESKGWKIHRIWSVDWFQNRDHEVRRLVSAIDDLRTRTQSSAQEPDSAVVQVQSASDEALQLVDKHSGGLRDGSHDNVPDGDRTTAVGEPPPDAFSAILAPPYVLARVSAKLRNGEQLHEVGPVRFGRWICEVVEAESPVHIEEVLRRVREAVGVQRAGNRIRTAFQNALARLSHSRRICLRNDFAWVPPMKESPVRSRAEMPAQYRNLTYVAPEERAAAILDVVRLAYSATESEAIEAAMRRLGFERTTAGMRDTMAITVETLVRHGLIERAPDGRVRAPARGSR